MKAIKILATTAFLISVSVQSMENPNNNAVRRTAFALGFADIMLKSLTPEIKVIENTAEVTKATDLKERLKKTLIGRLPKYNAFSAIYSALLVPNPADYSYIGTAIGKVIDTASELTFKDVLALGMRIVSPAKNSSLTILEHPYLMQPRIWHAELSGSSGPFKGIYTTSVKDADSICINFFEHEKDAENLKYLSASKEIGMTDKATGKEMYARAQAYLVCDFDDVAEYLTEAMKAESLRKPTKWQDPTGLFIVAQGKNNSFEPSDIIEASLMSEDGSMQTIPLAPSSKKEVIDAEKTTKHTVVLFMDKISESDVSL